MSLEWRSTLAALASFALIAPLLSGCAASERLQPGLANGPRLGGDAPVLSHDAVANAADSCPEDASGGDPLPQRFPPCRRTPEQAPSLALFRATVHAPPPALGRWKFHLEGLPPCEDRSAPWVAPESGPLCIR